MKENIQKLLKSKMVSNYTISKETGIAQSTISGYVTGSSKIGNMKLDHALLLNDYYTKNWKEKVEEMENIKEVISKVEAWEIKLVDAEPDYHERDYTDAATEQYIIHKVGVEMEDDEELEVFFAECDYVKELREQIYSGEKNEDDFEELVINELSDQYDYDKVVAYRIGNGQIEWI